MMIDDPIQYLEGQAHEIELKAIRDLRGGRAQRSLFASIQENKP